MKTYSGSFIQDVPVVLTSNGEKVQVLKPDTELFDWGHACDGADELALVLLADVLNERTMLEKRAEKTRCWFLAQQFARECVSRWNHFGVWTITDIEILAWVRQQEAKIDDAMSSNSPTYGASKSTPGTAEGGL